MQSQQPAYVSAVQVHDPDPAMRAGGDAWSRSAGLVIFAIAVIGVLFVGALLLMYFGMVQPKGTPEAVAPAAVDAPAPRIPSAAPEAPPPLVAVDPPNTQPETIVEAPAHSEPSAASLPPEARVAAPPSREPRSTSEPNPRATAAAQRARRETAPVEVPEAAMVAAPLSAPANDVAAKAEAPAAAALPAPPPPIEPTITQSAAIEPAPARPSPPAAVARADVPETLAPVVLRPIARPQPQFPRQALLDGVTRGAVVARVTVATDGHVSAVTIVSSNPPRLFDRAVRNALADWRFEPIPRPTTAQIDFAFRAE